MRDDELIRKSEEYCNKYRDNNGTLCVKDEEGLENFLIGLMSIGSEERHKVIYRRNDDEVFELGMIVKY